MLKGEVDHSREYQLSNRLAVPIRIGGEPLVQSVHLLAVFTWRWWGSVGLLVLDETKFHSSNSLAEQRQKVLLLSASFLLAQVRDDRIARHLKPHVEGVVLPIQPALREQCGLSAVADTVGDVECQTGIESDQSFIPTVVSGSTLLRVSLMSGIEGEEVVTHFRCLLEVLLLVGSYCYLAS